MVALLLLPLAGFLIGALVALLGGGGGIFYVALLTAGFGMPLEIAVPTSLATIVPTTLIAAYAHHRRGHVHWPIGRWMAGGGVIGALLGAWLTTVIPEPVARKGFALFLLVMGFFMLRARWRRRHVHAAPAREPAPHSPRSTPGRDALAAGFGLLGGVMAGLLGISGTPPILAGLQLLGLRAAEIAGTSVFVLLVLALAGFAGHLHLGHVDWLRVVLLGVGTTAGAFIAPHLLGLIDERRMERLFTPVFLSMVLGFGVYLLIA
ncbi:MAG: sulfite exporter TauE/SafE family protein [Fulvimonas sp.]|nr:sulfite exporter TauE/SafE family protein [Fulvimonas sp.]